MKHSTIFKNRWWALIWAAGILWFAYDVAGSAPGAEGNNSANATDASGDPVSTDQSEQALNALNSM